jgi:hypothetical protein
MHVLCLSLVQNTHSNITFYQLIVLSILTSSLSLSAQPAESSFCTHYTTRTGIAKCTFCDFSLPMASTSKSFFLWFVKLYTSYLSGSLLSLLSYASSVHYLSSDAPRVLC